jgi:phage gp29-like protein
VRYNDPDNEQERQQAASIAQAIIDNVAIAVPKTFEYDQELLKIARSQDPKVYQNFFEKMQYAITRRTLGETLTSFGNEGGTGSQAQGKTHADTFDTRSVSLSKALMAIINDQVVRPLVMWNFGPAAPMPKWTVEIKDGGDLVKRLAVDAGLQRMGKKFTVGYIAERYDVPLATGENEENPDDVLIPNITAPNVAITDKAQATFAEGSLEEQVHREMDEYDKIFAQLRGDATGLFKHRVGELARAVTPIAGE